METWKDIIGYEGLYQVSNKGRVRSVSRVIVYSNGQKCRYAGAILNPSNYNLGYKRIILCRNQIEISFFVHRLVAIHFIPNPFSKPQVNHRGGDKTDNRYFRLQWNTSSENNKHAVDMGLRVSSKGELVNGAKLDTKKVIEIRKIGKSLKVAEIAKMYGISNGNVSAIINRKSWSHI